MPYYFLPTLAIFLSCYINLKLNIDASYKIKDDLNFPNLDCRKIIIFSGLLTDININFTICVNLFL